MSSSDPRQGEGALLSRRAALRLLGTGIVVAPVLAACGTDGFRPLYAEQADGGSADARFAQVDFTTIPGRVGQRIRNELVFQATGGGNAQQPAYRVDVAIREFITSTLVSRTGDSFSQIYNLDATFRLTDLKTQKVVLEGTSYGRAAFERFTSIYANVRAREDAENRAARTVAGDMKGRIAAFLV